MNKAEIAYTTFMKIVNRRTKIGLDDEPIGTKILPFAKFEDLHPYEKEAWEEVIKVLSN